MVQIIVVKFLFFINGSEIDFCVVNVLGGSDTLEAPRES